MMKLLAFVVVFSALLAAGCLQQSPPSPVISGNPPASSQLQSCISDTQCSSGESCYSGYCLRAPACIADEDCRRQQNCAPGDSCSGGYCDIIEGDEVGSCGYAKPSDPFPLPAETPGSETEPPGEPIDSSDLVSPTTPGNETEPPGEPPDLVGRQPGIPSEPQSCTSISDCNAIYGGSCLIDENETGTCIYPG